MSDNRTRKKRTTEYPMDWGNSSFIIIEPYPSIEFIFSVFRFKLYFVNYDNIIISRINRKKLFFKLKWSQLGKKCDHGKMRQFT